MLRSSYSFASNSYGFYALRSGVFQFDERFCSMSETPVLSLQLRRATLREVVPRTHRQALQHFNERAICTLVFALHISISRAHRLRVRLRCISLQSTPSDSAFDPPVVFILP